MIDSFDLLFVLFLLYLNQTYRVYKDIIFFLHLLLIIASC